jgi:hypothetical protein
MRSTTSALISRGRPSADALRTLHGERVRVRWPMSPRSNCANVARTLAISRPREWRVRAPDTTPTPRGSGGVSVRFRRAARGCRRRLRTSISGFGVRIRMGRFGRLVISDLSQPCGFWVRRSMGGRKWWWPEIVARQGISASWSSAEELGSRREPHQPRLAHPVGVGARKCWLITIGVLGVARNIDGLAVILPGAFAAAGSAVAMIPPRLRPGRPRGSRSTSHMLRRAHVRVEKSGRLRLFG